MRMIIAQAREKDARARASGVLRLRTPPSPAPPGGRPAEAKTEPRGTKKGPPGGRPLAHALRSD